MAPHQRHKTAVVAVFLAALVLALPAAAYRPEAAGYTPGGSTPAEATPTEAAGSTPAEAGTPVAGGYTPGAAASTPAEATPTEASTTDEATPTEAAAVSTPAEATPTEAASADASTPAKAGYTPAAAAVDTTPAALESGKATTDVQKLMEMVNGVYKKALEEANVEPSDGKFPVFYATFDEGIKAGLADRTLDERVMFTTGIDRAIKEAYHFTSAASNGAATEEQRFYVFVFTLTEALRVMAATVEAHAVKPAAEEQAAAGGAVKEEPAGAGDVIGKIDAAVKAGAGASKEAPLSDKFLVFEATFSKAFKDAMGPAFDKAIPQLDYAYKVAYKATVAAEPEKRFDAFLDGLTSYIIAVGQIARAAAKTGDASKPAAEAATNPAAEAAYKPAAAAAVKPASEAAAKPAAEAAYKPAAEAAAKPAGGAVGGYNL